MSASNASAPTPRSRRAGSGQARLARTVGDPRRTAFALTASVLLLAACGGSSDAVAPSASQDGRMRTLAAALNPAGWVAVQQPNDALLQNLTIPVDAPTRGMWSGVGSWPMLGLHQAVMPNGRVLTWGTTPDGNAQNGRYFDVWDPNRGLFDAGAHNLTFDPARQDSFCAPSVWLGDGRLMITGGNSDSPPGGGPGGSGRTNQIYTPATNGFVRAADVADARWYSAMVTMADGRVMMLGGIKPFSEGQWTNVAGALQRGESAMTPEIYENGAWRTLFGAESRTAFGPDFLRASLPKVWLAPDGRVFGIGSDQMYYVDANANGGSGATISMGQYKPPPGGQYDNNNAPNVGPTMSAVMYAPGKVLTVGGNAYQNGNGFWASRMATSIDINGGGAVKTEQPMMAFARNFANTIVLPDGKVLVTGGEGRANNDPVWQNGANAAEIWNPATGTWSTMASAAVFRGYHSQTSLLPNGTVLSTGGGNPGPVQLKGEVFYPPYLFRTVNGTAQLAPRPQLVGVSSLKHTHGAPLQFDLSNNGAIAQVALIGLSSGTHSFNAGQRRIPLSFTQDNFRITATLPNANLAPPGYYQLIALDANGVPSRGTIIAVGASVAAPPVATTAYTPPDTGTAGPPPPPPPPSGTTPPATAIACATEGGTCTLPVGSTATIYYGAGTTWFSRTGVTGGLACDNATFGDPALGTAKACVYAVTSPPPPSTVGAQPVGAWSFDAVTGATAPDASANNRPLTLANTTLVAGQVGQAVQFNGANASGSTGGPVIDTAGSFSVSTWVRLDQLTGWRTMVNQDGAVASGFWLQYSEFVGNKFLLSMHDADANGSTAVRAVGTTTPVVGQWYHVVGVRDKAAGTMKIHLNGRLEATTSYAGGWAANGSFNVGRGKFNGPNDWLAGALDQVKVFGSALTDAQVTALYNAENPPAAPSGPVALGPVNAPLIAAGGTAIYTVPATAGVTYSWDFGDGSPPTANSASASATRVFANPGIYVVTLTARTSAGITSTYSFLQAVRGTATAVQPTQSAAVAIEARANAPARLWVANPDNDTVSVIDTATNARVAEIPVGRSPRSVAMAADGRIWVTNKEAATISVIAPATLTVVQTLNLPAASRPHGLAFVPGGSALVVLEGSGRLLKLDPVSGATQASLALGPNLRHVSVSGDGATAFVSRFVTPPMPGEGTATVNTAAGGGELLVVSPGPMTLGRTVQLRHSDKIDSENQGAGLPNYLGAAAISPDGRSAWVPSKQDNIRRGTLRNGQPLNFQNTVRAISSRIDLVNQVEDAVLRVDHDNASLASAAAFHPSGAYLFVALETSRQLAVVDPVRGRELLKVDVGRAPQGVAVSADGTRVYVQNFMDRSISVLDLGPLLNQGVLRVPLVATVRTVGTERLAANVLQGKQFFYDARDPRLARDSYMSCASCHNDAGHDGRTWDFTHLGEGLRNTPVLRGRAGMGQGLVHWSANFDEVQDFEGQIRSLAGGSGLMSDAQFNAGTRNTPLGDRKAGVSADLDALAAYLASLSAFDPSPNRNPDGTLTAAAVAGRTVFTNAGCASCHGGSAFAGSGDAAALKNIGTLKPSSGKRLNGPLTGIDVPTLRDVWLSAPYLHDGSAATLAAAVQAHQGNTVGGVDLDNLVAYLQQIGAQEASAPGGTTPPTVNRAPIVSLTAPVAGSSANTGSTVTLTANATDPDGSVVRVEFYAGSTLLGSDTTAPHAVSWAPTAAGSYAITAVAVDNAGASATSTAVTLQVTAPASAWTFCANQGGICRFPGNATVRYTNPALGQSATLQATNLTFCLPNMFGLPFDAGKTGRCEWIPR